MAQKKLKVSANETTVSKTGAKERRKKETAVNIPEIEDKKSPPETSPSLIGRISAVRNYRPRPSVYIGAAIIGLSILAVTNKSLFVAATINGSPVSNLELQSRLNTQFRQQVLNEMINEKIILDEAKSKKIIVQKSEIDNQVTELEGNMGGKDALDNILNMQGQTRGQLRDQIKIRLLAEKMYGAEATVSAEEVDQFITENKDQLQSTEPAEQIKEAREILEQQKLSQIFSTKFQELKQAAQIKVF